MIIKKLHKNLIVGLVLQATPLSAAKRRKIAKFLSLFWK